MECMQDVLIERPTIEDIMLANVEGEKRMLFSLVKKEFSNCKEICGYYAYCILFNSAYYALAYT